MLAILATLGSKLLPFVTGINVPGILGGLWSAISGLGQNIVTNWKAWLIALLIALQVGTGYGFYHEHDKYIKEVAAHAADNAKFVAVQKTADLNEQNVKHQLQVEGKAAKNEADTNYSSLLGKYNASLMRYAQTAGGSTISAGHSQLPTSSGLDGPSTDTNLPAEIIVTGSDAQICAANTARLQAAHDWAIEQLKEKKDNK